MLLFLAADGDGLTKKLNQAKISNNIEEIRRISNNISKGNALFSSFALRALGSTIEEQGDEILIDFDAVQLSELESIRKQYVTIAETTVSVGIGKKVSEAVRALLAAKLKGGNCSVFYDKDVEKEIKEAEASTEEARVKTVAQYLAKAQQNFSGGEGQGTSNMDAPALNTLQTPALPLTTENDQEAIENNAVPQDGQVQGGPDSLQPQVTPTPSLDISHFEQEFKNHANNQESAEKAGNLKTSEGYTQIKKQVAEALINIKNQMGVISSLRTQAPDTYEAIMGVIRGIIMLGREISNTDDKIEKAESLIKGIVSPVGVVHNVEAQSDGDTSLGIAGSDALDKDEVVARILQAEGRGKTVIFTKTKRQAASVCEELIARGFRATALHGDMSQEARERSLNNFRTGKKEILVATEVAARGIDVDDVTHVINYTVPEDQMAYLHRIGRTGRAGRTGIAITFVDWDDLTRWGHINTALELNVPEPVETYSSSPHLFTDLDIPAGTKGRLASAPPAKKAEPKNSSRPQGKPVERKAVDRKPRQRTRTYKTD